MRRVLFVDDEQNILDGLQSLLRKYRFEMDMVFALGGDAALTELSKAPADVIVSDMRMPGMDGAALLGKVKEEYSATVRIILSGNSEQESVYRALPVAHQFLSKPCEVDRLCNVLKRSCQLRTLLDDNSIREALGRIDRLPPLPKTYGNLVEAFAKPDFSFRMIADIVETDSAMCTKMLQLVNSAFFGRNAAVTSIERAVAYLGIDLIKDLTLSANVLAAMEKVPSFPGFSFETLQTHALLTAKVAKAILPSQSADVFTAALLHDIGYNVLACSDHKKFQAVIDAQSRTERPACDVETEIFGVTHSNAGAYLLGLWGLPFPFIETVAYHHNPKAAGEQRLDLPSAVSAADALVYQALEGGAETVLPAFLTDHLQTLGVLSELPKWREVADREVGDWKGTN